MLPVDGVGVGVFLEATFFTVILHFFLYVFLPTLIFAVKVAFPAFLPLIFTLFFFFLLIDTIFLPFLFKDHVVFFTLAFPFTFNVFDLPTLTVNFFAKVGFLAAASAEAAGAIAATLNAITTARDFAITDLTLFFKTVTSYFIF